MVKCANQWNLEDNCFFKNRRQMINLQIKCLKIINMLKILWGFVHTEKFYVKKKKWKSEKGQKKNVDQY